ncbi:MAG: 4Fe-4S binding protein [Gammaproteobacteria bacterium]|nr:4Fe-4S binding protein [Gammaproteobacteria bacterium]
MKSRYLVLRWFAGLLGVLSGLSAAHAGSYESELPPELFSSPEMCTYTVCQDVLPGAEKFSVRKGRPFYVEGYRTEDGQEQLTGYVYLSTDIVDIPAYSGKPIITLMGMDTKGSITGIKILRHSEPILLVGIPESDLDEFINQYVGKFVGSKVEIGKAREEDGYISVDAISGATVTVIAENQAIMRSGYEVARQTGILKVKPKPRATFSNVEKLSTWDELIDEGSVKRLTVTPQQVGLEGSGEPYIDIYFGYLKNPAIGKSILGEENYQRFIAGLGPSDHPIFLIANGTASFKGSGFVRGGIYDRIQVAQDMETITFRDTDYLNLYGIHAAGAPRFKESGIFIMRSSTFSVAYPWDLVFLGNKVDKETGTRAFANFDQEYWLPDRYLEGGRPHYERPDPVWLAAWKARWPEITVFAIWLLAAVLVYANRDKLVRRARRKDKRWVSLPKYGFWLISIGFVGFYTLGQPSITQVLTWFHSLLYEWKWELFLTDPFIFLFWWFMIVTVFFWGRGLFCGWMCPYGSMSELLYKIGSKIGLKRFQFSLPRHLHDKLKWGKYLIFASLLAISFYSMPLAEKLAEVEPFKTTFLVGVWNRSWPFVLFWSILFGLSIFTERPFCKYLCPLGAGLAIPTTFRFFGLKRKAECTTCHACAKGCGSQAIDAQGKIDHRECLLCLDCMVLYFDDHACPPLSQERKRRQKAGLPLTAIDAEGYFIPVEAVQEALQKKTGTQA